MSCPNVIEDPEMTVKESLKLPDKQNECLATNEWVITRGTDSRDAMSSHFAALISDEPLEALKALNFQPYCGLGWATIRLSGKECKEEGNVKGNMEPVH